jgi:hypothetical protein
LLTNLLYIGTTLIEPDIVGLEAVYGLFNRTVFIFMISACKFLFLITNYLEDEGSVFLRNPV